VRRGRGGRGVRQLPVRRPAFETRVAGTLPARPRGARARGLVPLRRGRAGARRRGRAPQVVLRRGGLGGARDLRGGPPAAAADPGDHDLPQGRGRVPTRPGGPPAPPAPPRGTRGNVARAGLPGPRPSSLREPAVAAGVRRLPRAEAENGVRSVAEVEEGNDATPPDELDGWARHRGGRAGARAG